MSYLDSRIEENITNFTFIRLMSIIIKQKVRFPDLPRDVLIWAKSTMDSLSRLMGFNCLKNSLE